MNRTTPLTVTQLNLPGQVHVADGPHDQAGRYVLHHALRRDLRVFGSAVRRTPLGDASTWAALAARWTRFGRVLHHHHAAEDEKYWPLLAVAVAERGTATDRVEVAAMVHEHTGIDPELTACGRAFAAVVDHPCDGHRNALDIRITAFTELLEEHLAHEETVVLPMLQRVWTPEEFAAAERGVQASSPLKQAPFILGWTMYGLPGPAQERMSEVVGPAYAVLHRLVRRRFERRERATFRYADVGC